MPARTLGLVNSLLIGVNLVVFGYELSLSDSLLEVFIHRWGATPADLIGYLSGAHEDPRVLTRLVTSLFIHSGWLHLLSNMLYLWIFGNIVESALGHVRYLFFYFLVGAAAGLVQASLTTDPEVPAIGASGAIAGVLGAYFFLFPGATVAALMPRFFFFAMADLPAAIMLVFWFISQFFTGVASITQTHQAFGGTGWWAHVGGFAAGLALLPVFRKRKRRSQYRFL